MTPSRVVSRDQPESWDSIGDHSHQTGCGRPIPCFFFPRKWKVLDLDQRNPQIAARLCSSLSDWKKCARLREIA